MQRRTQVAIECWRCGVTVHKDLSEVNRSTRLGRNLFCSRSCSAESANEAKRSVEFEMPCPVCGVVFTTTTHNKAKRYCSRSCASKGSMTESRRAAQRASGLQHAKNLQSQAATLKQREAWKYTALKEALRGRRHEFEFKLGRFIFDLALLDEKVLVEFDGPYHQSVEQRALDARKDRVAKRHGFRLERRRVQRSVVIAPATIAGL